MGKLDKGGVSEVVETETGAAVLKVTEKTPAVTKPLTEVRATIKGILEEEKARALVAERIGRLEKLARKEKSLDVAAQKEGLKPASTGALKKGDPLGRFRFVRAPSARPSSRLKEKEISAPIFTYAGEALAELKTIEPERRPRSRRSATRSPRTSSTRSRKTRPWPGSGTSGRRSRTTGAGRPRSSSSSTSSSRPTRGSSTSASSARGPRSTASSSACPSSRRASLSPSTKATPSSASSSGRKRPGRSSRRSRTPSGTPSSARRRTSSSSPTWPRPARRRRSRSTTRPTSASRKTSCRGTPRHPESHSLSSAYKRRAEKGDHDGVVPEIPAA